jgi:hypothetical protein
MGGLSGLGRVRTPDAGATRARAPSTYKWPRGNVNEAHWIWKDEIELQITLCSAWDGAACRY